MNRVLTILTKFKTNLTFSRFYGSLYEPEYLKYLEPEFPVYPTLNVQLKAYDFTVLEHYASYVAKTARHLGINVDEIFPIPGQKLSIHNYLPGTTTQDQEFKLSIYERNVKISELTSILAPIFIDVIQNSIPAGVQIKIVENTEELDNNRYIPDLELIELKQQIESDEKPKRKI